MTMIFSGKAEVVEESETTVRSASTSWVMPSVVRQFTRFKRRKTVQFSRLNVYTRDNWTCQYCDKKKAAKDLTFDHVIPRAHGGGTSWTNIVTACKPCNVKKADKTVEKAKMVLLRKPEEPRWLPTQMVIRTKDIPASWKPYVGESSLKYWEIEIEMN